MAPPTDTLPFLLQGENASGNLGSSAGTFAVAFVAVYLLGRWGAVPVVARIVRVRNPRNPTLRAAAERYATVVVAIVALTVAVVGAGYGGVLTRSSLVVAAATLALGVAGQEVIGSVVSGLFLVADPDFNVGDWVAWNENEGVVESVAFRVTRIRTPNNEVLTVPNTQLTTNTIANPYGRDRFRVTEPVAVGYEVGAAEAATVLREAATADERVLDQPPPTVRFVAFGDDALELEVQYWIADPTRGAVTATRLAVADEIQRRFADADLALSPPSQRELGGEVAVRDADAADDAAGQGGAGGNSVGGGG